MQRQVSLRGQCEFFVKFFTSIKINDNMFMINKIKGGIFVIEVKNVTKKYGKSVAVEDISFSINDGEIVGLL